MMNHTTIVLIATPLIGALIGWLTNWIAVKMLFHPHREVNLLFMRVQGLIPRRRSELAESVGQTVASELLNLQDIQKVLQDPALQGQIHDTLESKVAGFLTERLQELNPMIAAMVPAAITETLREQIVNEIMGLLPGLLDSLTDHMEERLNIQSIVKEKIETFELQKLEDIVLRIASGELRHIEILGGILGFIIGLVNAGIVILVF